MLCSFQTRNGFSAQNRCTVTLADGSKLTCTCNLFKTSRIAGSGPYRNMFQLV